MQLSCRTNENCNSRLYNPTINRTEKCSDDLYVVKHYELETSWRTIKLCASSMFSYLFTILLFYSVTTPNTSIWLRNDTFIHNFIALFYDKRDTLFISELFDTCVALSCLLSQVRSVAFYAKFSNSTTTQRLYCFFLFVCVDVCLHTDNSSCLLFIYFTNVLCSLCSLLHLYTYSIIFII